MSDDLLHQAQAWIDDDPDPTTRDELTDLVKAVQDGDAAARAELADRFTGLLQFGTAGLRGAMAAGPHRMNRAVVLRAAAGLVAHLAATVDTTAGPVRLVVGYDARHRSHDFALDTVATAVAAGVETFLLPGPLPTPVLADAVRRLDADAGVMVTASHNPPQDNGYKVYLGARAVDADGRGAQIVPPYDAAIAARIGEVGRVADIARAADGWHVVNPDEIAAYRSSVVALVDPQTPRDLDLVYTPLHGVGAETAVAVLTAAGFTAPHVVPEQAAPDPDFPTVAFPNPEEPGAIDLALAAAAARGADLVLANDPDADRLAVAVPDPAAGTPTGWRMLRGDELGRLLAHHVLTRRTPPAGATVACSIVSSQMLARLAAAHEVDYVETLTGFKWIARTPHLVYGYEEALGYCVDPDGVRDKDGVSAALLVAECAASLKAAGRTVLDVLDELETTHGVHATDQLSVRVDDLRIIADAMARLRSTPPERLGGAPVSTVDDLALGGAGLPPTDGLRLRTAAGVRIVVRPSGTEPKLKCYLESVVPVGTPEELAESRAVAAERLAAVRADLQAHLLP